MNKPISSNLQTIVRATLAVLIFSFAATLAVSAQAAYTAGEKIEVLWSGTWYRAKVLETKGTQYKIHYDDWASSWDEWVKPDRMRRVPKFTGEAQAKWGINDAWRDDYSVGDKVELSISGKAADYQTCTIAENKPQEVMRAKCDAFKGWVAGVYIVHSEGSLRRDKPRQTDDEPIVEPKKKTGGNSSSLKVGEYACTGSGGRMMIGLGFKVVSSSRYTDLDGKRAGTFTITNGFVKFQGGHLSGVTGRDLKDNWFTVASQAQCGPF